MSYLPLGLVSWILIGLVAGLAARRFLPGQPPLGWGLVVFAGIGSALAGGLLASVLGFGGLLGFDVRALATATLGAIFCLLLIRTFKLAPGAPSPPGA